MEVRFRKDYRGVYDVVRLDHRQMDRLEDDGKLVGFRQRDNVDSFRKTGRDFTAATSDLMPGKRKKAKEFSPFRIIHWKLPDSSDSFYGRSVMEAARRTWRQVRLMEDSIVIYRISRGAERRVFYINVGNLADDEAEGYIRQLKTKFHKKA